MIGLVLAAGAGRRLRPLTDHLPKTLLPVDGEITILDVVLRNLAAAGLSKVVIVVGYGADIIGERVPELERRHAISVELIHNPKAQEWNNAYSLWLAREHFGSGALLVNGDTVHPVSVEFALLSVQVAEADVILAVDTVKSLADEEMKVALDGRGRLASISKQLDPAAADGEYIGASLVNARAAESLAEALEATWRRDPGLYYEDGYQELAHRGGKVAAVPIGAVEWVEVDTRADLARARDITCRC